MKSASIRLFVIVTQLCLFHRGIANQQPSCDSLVWTFGVNQFAIDGDQLVADLENKGWNREYFESHLVELMITGATDCPGSMQHNTKLAINRARYLLNFFETTGYPNLTIKECFAIPERGCVKPGQGYNPDDRMASVVFCSREIVQKAAEPAPEPTPEPMPEPEPIDAGPLNAISSLEPGQTLVVDGLNFYPGSHRTLPEAKTVLKQLVQILNDNPSLVVEIQGHVCCGKKPEEDGLDEETGEMKLSWNRAKYVYQYLVEQGIDPLRLTYKGYAMKKPLAWPEVTIQDQIKNRRVEILVVSK
jgi:outer membrane protein OmpA-like peptidoglycan-associated protein